MLRQLNKINTNKIFIIIFGLTFTTTKIEQLWSLRICLRLFATCALLVDSNRTSRTTFVQEKQQRLIYLCKSILSDCYVDTYLMVLVFFMFFNKFSTVFLVEYLFKWINNVICFTKQKFFVLNRIFTAKTK